MPHQLLKFPRAPNNENAQVLPTMEQVLEVLFEVVPYMPVESQISFTSMFRDNTPSPPPDEAPSQHARISLLSDSLHNYVQEKTYVYVSRHSYRFNFSSVFSIYSNLIWHFK